LATPVLRRASGIPFELRRVADKGNPNVETPLRQQSRRYETVTAIVTRTGDHNDPRALLCGRGVSDRAARILHEVDTWRAAGDRRPVGLGHLGGGEKFDHRCRQYRPQCPFAKAGNRRMPRNF
jgi:hypothetical protein